MGQGPHHHSNQLNLHPSPDQLRRALQGFDGDVAVVGIEQAGDLGAARGEARLAEAALAHRFGELPGDDLLDSLGLELGEHAFFLEEAVEVGATVTVLGHFRTMHLE